jgi:hypothetical protein
MWRQAVAQGGRSPLAERSGRKPEEKQSCGNDGLMQQLIAAPPVSCRPGRDNQKRGRILQAMTQQLFRLLQQQQGGNTGKQYAGIEQLMQMFQQKPQEAKQDAGSEGRSWRRIARGRPARLTPTRNPKRRDRRWSSC